MIQLTRLNHAPLVLNSDLIEHMEVTPDTVVTLTTGQKIVVLESAEEVVERIIRFRKSIIAGAAECPLRRSDLKQQAFVDRNDSDEVDG
jgi:flagellar protein FlbD